MRIIMVLIYMCMFIIATFSRCTDGAQFRFDYDFHSEASGWFKVNLIPATWHEARLRCHLEGSVLASPLNDNMQAAMMTLMSAHGVPARGIFTGLNSIFSKGDYSSIEGVPLTRIKIRWAPGEPSNYNNSESCLAMHTNGSMLDVNCEARYAYICYKKMPANTKLVLNECCGTVDHEYKFYPLSDSCYKFHNQPQNWSMAHMTCMAEGGHLVIINSGVEAEVLKGIHKENPSIPIIGNYQKDVVLAGFHDWGVINNWVTVHGETLQKAGYASWGDGQPNNMACGQSCGGFFRATALLADLCCSHLYPFICEKSPNSLLRDVDD